MKKIIAWAIILCTAAFVFSACSDCSEKLYDETNISELYDKEQIVGKSRSEIQKEYGEFNSEFISDNGEDLGAYYVNYDNDGIDPSYIHDTFFVEFDADGIAIDAYFRKTSVGG